jgi:hypothetical protein
VTVSMLSYVTIVRALDTIVILEVESNKEILENYIQSGMNIITYNVPSLMFTLFKLYVSPFFDVSHRSVDSPYSPFYRFTMLFLAPICIKLRIRFICLRDTFFITYCGGVEISVTL